jgi:FPC/CPF motif-containing protein YcgG
MAARRFDQDTGVNPFSDELARANSTYAAFRDGKLVRVLQPEQPVTPLAEFVHDSLRALVLNPKFSCVGAKAAFRRNTYRFSVYSDMASPEATAGLAHDLWTFVQEQPGFGSDFATFAASFEGPMVADEHEWERLVWAQLQRLHELDRRYYAWDSSVSSDPDAANFSFSVAGQAFFVVGLHGASSRWARRFAWPTLVFNAHHQFARLRAQGKFARMRDVIRTRDLLLQGSLNANLSDFGDRSEARQYSGRPVEPDWRCPFHAHTENDGT